MGKAEEKQARDAEWSGMEEHRTAREERTEWSGVKHAGPSDDARTAVVPSLLREGSDRREEPHGAGAPCRRRRGTGVEAPPPRLGGGGVRGGGGRRGER